MKMKAISLRQPYANQVARGIKTIETRTWATSYRGDLLICAAKAGSEEPRGVALCIVRLTEIRRMRNDDGAAACTQAYPHARAWLLDNLRLIKPFPVKGKLGVFEVEVPDDIGI